MPELEAQQAPDLARESAGAIEARHDGLGVDERALAGVGLAEDVFGQSSQLAMQPLRERDRKAHLVASIENGLGQLGRERRLEQVLHLSARELDVGRYGREELDQRVVEK